MRYLAALIVACALGAFAQAQPSVPPAAPYREAATALEKLIAREVDDKKLPALSIALVDDQKVVWAAGFGFQDRARQVPATAETVYRVGSVSKLFTDVAVMQLVEEGRLDLDSPVAKYLPEFKPAYKEGEKPVTLRMLMSHRSGLIREPPVGNYFDPSEPGLAKTVASLNGVGLIYPPGSRLKYSNAAIAVVGYALEQSQKEQFEKCVQRRVLEPLGMRASSFLPTPAVKKGLADAVMWTYHGKEFPAPTFELGEAPAGCMYSTVLDLAKFQSCLFADGKVNGKPLLKPGTLKEMLTPQFAKGPGREFGLGFVLGELDGQKRVGHGGAIYGFATEFAALPGEKLGVVVVSSRDVSNALMTRIANDALRQMTAAKAGKPLPALTVGTRPVPTDEAAALAGRYRGANGNVIDVTSSFGNVYLQFAFRGGEVLRVRKSGDEYVFDDVQQPGGGFTRDGDTLRFGDAAFTKEKPATEPPAEPPAAFKGLLGEYGWDHLPLVIYEKDGKLHALIEHTEVDVLTEVSGGGTGEPAGGSPAKGADVFAFPADRGMYHGERLVFARDPSGRAAQVTAASVVMERRATDGDGGTFKVKPVKPLAEVRKAALVATPPAEKGDFLKPDLVDLATLDGIKFDIRYASDNNFLGVPFYTSAKAYMQKPAADALGRVHAKLKGRGYGLLVFDAYRPWHVTKMFWDATPEKFHTFVADPAKGSRHNRGCAVDLTLYDLKTGRPVETVSGYDEFSDRAFPDYLGGTSRQRWHRDLLRAAMQAEGFGVYEEEWWHFDYKDWKKYPILNKTFEELK